jgi:L-threonylcarbamoyladenylate synthase
MAAQAATHDKPQANQVQPDVLKRGEIPDRPATFGVWTLDVDGRLRAQDDSRGLYRADLVRCFGMYLSAAQSVAPAMTMRPATPEAIADAAAHLRDGALVAFPTETVYGLGADATNGKAVARIFAAKGRPSFNPLIVHVTDLAAAEKIGIFNDHARALARAFWPGPLSIVVPQRLGNRIADLATAGLATVAIRVPSHPVAQALLKAATIPIAAPSANRSGHVSPTSAVHVAADFTPDALTLILDAGASTVGLESTVLDASSTPFRLLRPGAVTVAQLQSLIGPIARALDNDAAPLSPGQLASHYAPRAAVRLNALDRRADEALLAFGAVVPTHSGITLNLSVSGDLIEAAANLFAALRALDASGVSGIAVMPIPCTGLGEAINDRLKRAAAPRPNGAP